MIVIVLVLGFTSIGSASPPKERANNPPKSDYDQEYDHEHDCDSEHNSHLQNETDPENEND